MLPFPPSRQSRCVPGSGGSGSTRCSSGMDAHQSRKPPAGSIASSQRLQAPQSRSTSPDPTRVQGPVSLHPRQLPNPTWSEGRRLNTPRETSVVGSLTNKPFPPHGHSYDPAEVWLPSGASLCNYLLATHPRKDLYCLRGRERAAVSLQRCCFICKGAEQLSQPVSICAGGLGGPQKAQIAAAQLNHGVCPGLRGPRVSSALRRRQWHY